MRKEIVLALTLVGGALVPVVAQDKPPRKCRCRCHCRRASRHRQALQGRFR